MFLSSELVIFSASISNLLLIPPSEIFIFYIWPLEVLFGSSLCVNICLTMLMLFFEYLNIIIIFVLKFLFANCSIYVTSGIFVLTIFCPGFGHIFLILSTLSLDADLLNVNYWVLHFVVFLFVVLCSGLKIICDLVWSFHGLSLCFVRTVLE